jgi:hypothetical protein
MNETEIDQSLFNSNSNETLLFEALMAEAPTGPSRPECLDLKVPFEVIQTIVTMLPNELRAAIIMAGCSLRDKAMKTTLESLGAKGHPPLSIDAQSVKSSGKE